MSAATVLVECDRLRVFLRVAGGLTNCPTQVTEVYIICYLAFFTGISTNTNTRDINAQYTSEYGSLCMAAIFCLGLNTELDLLRSKTNIQT